MRSTFDPLHARKEVAIYGYSKAAYGKVREAVSTGLICYDWAVSSEPIKSLSGRVFVHTRLFTSAARYCKLALVSFVIENYLRKAEGFKFIQVVFCLTSDKYPAHPPIEAIANIQLAADPIQGRITHQELRIIYKLCTYPDRRIREVALKTFHFVHVQFNGDTIVGFKKTLAPWQDNPGEMPIRQLRWESAWAAKKRARKPAKPYALQWRLWLENPMQAQRRIDALSSLDVPEDTNAKTRKLRGPFCPPVSGELEQIIKSVSCKELTLFLKRNSPLNMTSRTNDLFSYLQTVYSKEIIDPLIKLNKGLSYSLFLKCLTPCKTSQKK